MKHFIAQPRTLTATENRLLRTIEVEVNWLADPKCLSHDDLEALEFLRYLGRIEKASFGGWKIRGSVKPASQPDIRGLLASVGVDVSRIRAIHPTKGAWLRPGKGQQVTVVFDGAVRLNGANVGLFASEVITDGAVLIMRLKE